MVEAPRSKPQRGRSAGLLSLVWTFVLRHRVNIQELGLLLAALLVLLYLSFEIDVFATVGSATPAERTVELNEALLLGGLLAIGLLAFSVRRFQAQTREIARRIAAEREARELAYQDPLTGLANRRQFVEALRVAVSSPPNSGGAHAVLLLDLNGFKQVNDNYGHGAGDEILVLVAQRMLRAVRDGDLVARIGGDEFVVLSRHLLGAEAATSVALRILQSFDEPFTVGDVRHGLGAGIGIALVPENADTEEEALRKADVALYRAKSERRSAFRFFEEDMDRFVHEREQLERDLRTAIDENCIQPRFRPSFDLQSGAVVGFEAVPTWMSPTGEIAMERFLPIAEETGLIHRLSTQMLEQACRAARAWPDGVMLSMDLFPGQLRDPNLTGTILGVCRDAGFDPHRLELEVAESTIVRDLDAAKAVLTPLRRAGVQVTLDHFGTGYSNLYHMQEFRLDRVKIDRRFVENMGEAEAARVVRALAGLGQGLGMAVTADGLAGSSSSASLLAAGVHVGQSSGEMVTAAQSQDFFGAEWPR